jgi:hypothetical protein
MNLMANENNEPSLSQSLTNQKLGVLPLFLYSDYLLHKLFLAYCYYFDKACLYLQFLKCKFKKSKSLFDGKNYMNIN